MKRVSVWRSLSVFAVVAVISLILFLSHRVGAQTQPPPDDKTGCCEILLPTSRTIAGPGISTSLLGVPRSSIILIDSSNPIELCATVQNGLGVGLFIHLSNRAGVTERTQFVAPREATAICGKAVRVSVVPNTETPLDPFNFRWRIDKVD